MNQNRISLIIHIYNNQELLDLQASLWGEWSELAGLEIIFIDDGSNPKLNLSGIPSWVKKYRVLDDISWNQPGAKNLAAEQSSADWLFFLDADQFLKKEDLIDLIQLSKNFKEKILYRFRRFSFPDLSELSSHQNCQIISKKDYIEHGGYDEDFAGHYGYEDAYFERLWIHRGNFISLLNKPFLIDRSNFETKNLNRNGRRNELLRRKKMLYWHLSANFIGRFFLRQPLILRALIKVKLIADGRNLERIRFNWEKL
jgi:glycosyltransferase involved in cell wall biosynthesis